MANVKGVILNGTKYELLDSEARQLAGDAINQVETLENTVTAVETDVTAIKADLVTVAETATEAKSTATEASTLATQAEAVANEKTPLIANGYLVKEIAPYGSLLIDGDGWTNLLGKPLTELKNGDTFILHDIDQSNRYQGKISGAVIKYNGTQMVLESPFLPTTEWTLDNGILTFKNSSTSAVTHLIYAIKVA